MFCTKKNPCVFLISLEKYFAFFETGEGLSIESGERASHCSTGSREGSSVEIGPNLGSPLDPRSARLDGIR